MSRRQEQRQGQGQGKGLRSKEQEQECKPGEEWMGWLQLLQLRDVTGRDLLGLALRQQVWSVPYVSTWCKY